MQLKAVSHIENEAVEQLNDEQILLEVPLEAPEDSVGIPDVVFERPEINPRTLNEMEAFKPVVDQVISVEEIVAL
jgi:hypothetical protein